MHKVAVVNLKLPLSTWICRQPEVVISVQYGGVRVRVVLLTSRVGTRPWTRRVSCVPCVWSVHCPCACAFVRADSRRLYSDRIGDCQFLSSNLSLYSLYCFAQGSRGSKKNAWPSQSNIPLQNPFSKCSYHLNDFVCHPIYSGFILD